MPLPNARRGMLDRLVAARAMLRGRHDVQWRRRVAAAGGACRPRSSSTGRMLFQDHTPQVPHVRANNLGQSVG
jgi:hypothetical protein